MAYLIRATEMALPWPGHLCLPGTWVMQQLLLAHFGFRISPETCSPMGQRASRPPAAPTLLAPAEDRRVARHPGSAQGW